MRAVPRLTLVDNKGNRGSLTAPLSIPSESATLLPFVNRSLSVPLVGPLVSGRSINKLDLTLTVEVAIPHGKPTEIKDILKSQGKAAFTPNGIRARILRSSYRSGGRNFFILISFKGPDGWVYRPADFGIEVLDQNGKQCQMPTPYFSRSILREVSPEQLALIGGMAPASAPLAHVPWAALYRTMRPPTRYHYLGSLRGLTPSPDSRPSTLRLTPIKKVQTEIPVSFQNIPLP